jgi:hypothetical protein
MIPQKDDLRPYKVKGLSVMQLMSLLAVAGIVLTALLKYLSLA